MLTGLARDGGLYVPETIPDDSAMVTSRPLPVSIYEEVAFRVMRRLLAIRSRMTEFRDIIARSLCRVWPCRARAFGTTRRPNHFLLELFHGPTLAFKDFAMQLIGQMFQTALARRGERVTIVGATSGDTGSAAIEAFKGSGQCRCLYPLPPWPRFSEVQRRQMTTPIESNVHAMAWMAILTIVRRV